MTDIINIKSNKRIEMLDVTGHINSLVIKSEILNGICIIHIPHTTAAITINENADIATSKDIINKLSSMIPYGEGYSHMEGNSDAHIKTSLFGPSLTLIIENGRLLLGTWQSVFFCEFDGPRNRKIFIKLISG